MTWLESITRRALVGKVAGRVRPASCCAAFLAGRTGFRHRLLSRRLFTALEERLSPILAGRTPRHRTGDVDHASARRRRRHGADATRRGKPNDGAGPRSEHFRHCGPESRSPWYFRRAFIPGVGQMQWKLNIRLAENSRVRAIAEMNDGESLSPMKPTLKCWSADAGERAMQRIRKGLERP